jgi:hypothetical protein
MAEIPETNSQTTKKQKTRSTWYKPLRPYLWGGGEWRPAARRLAIIIPFAINLILIILLGVLAQQLFTIKNFINQDLIGGLYYNFVLMDRAHITTTVQVNDTILVSDTIPVVFDLELAQDTEVVLTRDTPIVNATIFLNNQPVPLDLTLRAGTPLNINLDLTVPVSQTVPVELDVPISLNVPVDIALADTNLHEPFVGLQNVVAPYFWKLYESNDSWADFSFCQGTIRGFFCKTLLLAD